MFDAVATALVCVTSAALTAGLLRRRPPDERRLLGLALAMHLVCSFALKYTQGNVYSEGDAGIYREASEPLLALMRRDVVRWGPQVLAATVHLDTELGFEDFSPTLSMITITALGRYAMMDSLWAFYALLAFFSFLGKWGIYATFRDELREMDKRWIAVAVLFLPSVVFWTAGLVKEAFALMGLGALFHGTRRVVTLRSARGIPSAALGTLLIALFKPYVLFPFAVGVGAWVFLERSKRVRNAAPVFLLLGAIVGYGLIVGLSALFPQFSPTDLAEQTAQLQLYGAEGGGGSYYGIGDAGARTIGGQLVYAPLALLTTLTRPALWEVHNGTSALASLEMTALTVLLVRAMVKRGRGGLRATVSTPIALFALVFSLFGAVAIGLATTNFGTLSRYRVPVMPFYAVLVGLMSSQVRAERLTKRALRGLPEAPRKRVGASAIARRLSTRTPGTRA